MRTPYLASELLKSLSASTSPRRVLVNGAPGTGKTTLLKRLRAELPGATFVAPGAKDAYPRVLEWLRAPQGTLLVDDLDEFFHAGVDAALGAVDWDDLAGPRIVATARLPLHLLAHRAHTAAPVGEEPLEWDRPAEIQRFCVEPLELLEPSESRAVVAKMMKAVAKEYTALRPEDSDPLDLPADWWDVVTRTTGLHPTLFGAAVEWSFHAADLKPPQLERARLVAHLEPSCGLFVKAAARWVELEGNDLEALLKLVRGEPVSVDEAPSRWLRRSGLVACEDGQLTVRAESVIGDALRAAVTELLGLRRDTLARHPGGHQPTRPSEAEAVGSKTTPERRPPGYELDPKGASTPGVEPDRLHPDDHGVLEFQVEERQVRLELTGNIWRVARAVCEAGGRALSVDEIHDRSGVKSKIAVRSAIQYLRDKLDRDGLPRVVVNIPRRGYAVDTTYVRRE